MNVIIYPNQSANIFPCVNSTAGGQLLSEFNIRSRETVGTPSDISYIVGPSYTHSDDDFKVTLLTDGSGTPISSTTLQISSGRALINGHYMESLTPVTVDITELNMMLNQDGQELLKGKLCIGLRAMYSTTQTMNGTLLPEDSSSGMYKGIQVVILPKYGDNKFTTPLDSPTDETLVNAHLKLAEFDYTNGSIITSSIVNNPEKSKILSANKIGNVGDLLSDGYVKKTGLDPKKIYAFSGKGTNPSTGYDTWCDSTDSLMVWDNNPSLQTGSNPGVTQATFRYNPLTETTQLVLPHKQPDGMTDTAGNPQYYADKVINLPNANYGTSTGGVVTPAYTNSIKAIEQKIDNLYTLPNGSIRQYIDILTDRTDLSPINYEWSAGDYILVGQDKTVEINSDTTSRYPATMYMVLPGLVQSISYYGSSSGGYPPAAGVQLGYYTTSRTSFDPTDISTVNSWFGIPSSTYRGTVNDYFTVYSTETNETYWYNVEESGETAYSEPIWVTGEIQFATTDVIGGFRNAPANAIGQGLVRLGDDGLLHVMDFELLVSGLLAYQLGENISISGLDSTGIQEVLTETVNDRIAFPNANQIANAVAAGISPNPIHIYITLTEEDVENNISIGNIDSRFNTFIYLHILGQSNSNTTINIANCEKIRLDISVTGSPTINLINSNLYYDANVINQLTTISGLKLWYEQFESTDPNLLVNDMTVELVGTPEAVVSEEYWTNDSPNDNHYSYALRSLTFAPDGSIINFVSKKPKKKIKLEDLTAYPMNSVTPEGYIVKDTSFTALTGTYNGATVDYGTISYKTNISEVTNVSGIVSTTGIDGWESGAFHIFEGGCIN